VVERIWKQWVIVNGTGNPQVSPAVPVPVPVKPVGIAAGTGFDGYGLRVCKNP